MIKNEYIKNVKKKRIMINPKHSSHNMTTSVQNLSGIENINAML